MEVEIITAILSSAGIVAAIAFGFLAWLRGRSRDDAETTRVLTTLTAKIEHIGGDLKDVGHDIKEVRTEQKSFYENQIQVISDVKSLDGRVTLLETKVFGGNQNAGQY